MYDKYFACCTKKAAERGCPTIFFCSENIDRLYRAKIGDIQLNQLCLFLFFKRSHQAEGQPHSCLDIFQKARAVASVHYYVFVAPLRKTGFFMQISHSAALAVIN